jgi:uncharacterized protein YecT (DUF1311 family)
VSNKTSLCTCLGRLKIAVILAGIILATLSSTVVAQSQLEMTDSARISYEKQDKLLNHLYDKLYSELSPLGKGALVKAERAWVKFRDSECNFETVGLAGASIRDMTAYNCLGGETYRRIADIRDQLTCPEVDPDCVRIRDGAEPR